MSVSQKYFCSFAFPFLFVRNRNIRFKLGLYNFYVNVFYTLLGVLFLRRTCCHLKLCCEVLLGTVNIALTAAVKRRFVSRHGNDKILHDGVNTPGIFNADLKSFV